MGKKQKLTRKEKAKQKQATKDEGAKRSVKSKSGRSLILLLLFLFGVALYFNTRNHGYVLDDHSTIDENWVVKQGTEGIPTILKTHYRYGYWSNEGTLYRPLSLIMFAIEWELAPDNPALGHLMNMILYGLTAMLLYVVLRNLFKEHKYLALIATLIFVAHPLHTEVVANIKGRDDLLCFLFLLVSMWAMLRYVDRGKVYLLILSWCSYFLAFMSKENAITFLAVFPIMLFFFRELPARKIGIICVGFVISAGAYLALRFQILGHVGGVGVSRIDNVLADAHGVGDWYATTTYILGKYLLLLFFPHPLANDYAYNQIPVVGWDNIGVLLSAVSILAILGFCIWRFRSRSILVFGVLLAVISVSVYTNYFITIGTHFAERLLYIPVLGLGIVVAWGLLKIWPVGKDQSLGSNKALTAVTCVILILMAGKTISRNAAWESDLVLHKTDIEINDRSARIPFFLGLEVMKVQAMSAEDENTRKEYLEESVALFNRALEIYPTYYQVYNQLGLAHYRLGDYGKALEAYKIGLEHVPQAIGLSNMAAIYFNRGEYTKALELYRQSVTYDPRFADGWMNLGSTYGVLQQYEESIEAFENGLKYDPDHLTMITFLAKSYENIGDQANAEKYRVRAAALQSAPR